MLERRPDIGVPELTTDPVHVRSGRDGQRGKPRALRFGGRLSSRRGWSSGLDGWRSWVPDGRIRGQPASGVYVLRLLQPAMIMGRGIARHVAAQLGSLPGSLLALQRRQMDV